MINNLKNSIKDWRQDGRRRRFHAAEVGYQCLEIVIREPVSPGRHERPRYSTGNNLINGCVRGLGQEQLIVEGGRHWAAICVDAMAGFTGDVVKIVSLSDHLGGGGKS